MFFAKVTTIPSLASVVSDSKKKNDIDINVTSVYINLTQIKQMIFFLALFQKYSLGLYAATLSIQKSNIMYMY